MTLAITAGVIKGQFILGQNPAVGAVNSKMVERGLAKLEWMVVRDFAMTETANFWQKGRRVRWHDVVLDAPGDSRSDLWFIYHLGKRLKQLYAGSTAPADAAIQALTWDYGERSERREPDAEAVLREINGYTVADRKQIPS